jgi:hypothetical protein
MSTQEAKNRMTRERFMSRLETKAQDIGAAIQHIQTSGEMLSDFVVPSVEIGFDQVYSQTGEALDVEMVFGGQNMKLHRNAVTQLAGRMGVSARDLQAEIVGPEWKKGVFIHRMDEYLKNHPGNFLVRKVDDTAKAILSDRYRRLNTAAIFLAFLQAAANKGAVLVGANNGELTDFLEVVHPEIVPVETEKNGIIDMVFGGQIRNSDFGAAKLELRIFGMNTVCLNGMTSKQMVAERHLGSKLEQTDTVHFTAETMEADTKARALAVRDIMGSVFDPENLQKERQRVKAMSDIDLDFTAKIKELPKLGVSVGECDLLTKTLMANDPEDGVQGANTLWKFAQGLTAVANKTGSEDRKRDLEDIASSMVAGYVK